ncbi:iron transporter [Nocardioides sp. B-3]|uniref:iron transporter n=1 Tax=Nocardioides sp. B-3 TaxID=2895565 RepID=UPI002152F556|nr:iron transporter [Nocardioides sp. B-3]UUZ61141.1 iron transporter [Nocardioides sp. B-3]
MYETVEAEIAERGGEQTSGEWRVGYIVEAAEPWFEEHGGHSSFREPRAGETHHIEIIPFEESTGRIVPDVPVTVEVVAADGTVVAEEELNFYYATFFHYATNFSIPEDGTYTLRATLGSPSFLRHGDEADGPALAEETTVEFADVELSAS